MTLMNIPTLLKQWRNSFFFFLSLQFRIYFYFINYKNRTATLSESFSIPLVQFDTESSTCGVVSSGNGIYFALFGLTDTDEGS